MNRYADVPWLDHETSFQHHEAAPRDADGQHRQRRINRQQKDAALESPDRAVHATGAFGKHDHRARGSDEIAHTLQDSRARILAIDEQMSRPLEMPAEKRDTTQRFLRHDSQLQRQRREENRDVVDALMVRRADLAALATEVLETGDADTNPRGLQDEPGPG